MRPLTEKHYFPRKRKARKANWFDKLNKWQKTEQAKRFWRELSEIKH